MGWWRRWPVPVFVGVTAAILLVGGVSPLGGLIALLLGAYGLGAYRRTTVVELALLALAVGLIVARFDAGLPALPPSFVVPYVVLSLPWLVGRVLRGRQLRADAFAARAHDLERNQATASRRAVAAERARIARELHDVVAHSVSVMLVQIGAARMTAKAAPESASEALLAAAACGREAMAELRHLLDLLHDGDGEPDLAPQPGLDQVPALVRRVGEAGLPVALRVEGRPRRLPPGIELAAYRVVQEALTNALRHSGLAPTAVLIAYGDDALRLEVRGAGRGVAPALPLGWGRGLVGMRERIALYGGDLDAGPEPGSGFVVRARLPLIDDPP